MGETVESPSRRAHQVVHDLTSTVFRKHDPIEVEDRVYEDGSGRGLLDMKSITRFPSYFLGTFSGLMNASDDSEDKDERVTPSGPFAAAWCFFVLIWASSYTANLAARLTASAAEPHASSISELSSKQASVCGAANSAYMDNLMISYPSLSFVTYSTMAEAVQLLQSGQCEAIIDSFAALQGPANGVTDLDPSSASNYCNVAKPMILGGQPSAVGLTDMAVGVRHDLTDVHSALSYWITTMRTCTPASPSSECYEGGSGGKNLELLRQYHIDKKNCGETHMSANSEQELTIDNFLFPILAVGFGGLIMVVYFSSKYLRKIVPFMYFDDIGIVLGDEEFENCFISLPSEGRRVLQLDKLEELLLKPENFGFKILIIKAAGRFYIDTDLRSFFILFRLANMLYPGHFDREVVDDDRLHLNTASNVSFEVEAAVMTLILRSIREYFRSKSTLENYTFVVRDVIQLKLLENVDFGENTERQLKLMEITDKVETFKRNSSHRSNFGNENDL